MWSRTNCLPSYIPCWLTLLFAKDHKGQGQTVVLEFIDIIWQMRLPGQFLLNKKVTT